MPLPVGPFSLLCLSHFCIFFRACCDFHVINSLSYHTFRVTAAVVYVLQNSVCLAKPMDDNALLAGLSSATTTFGTQVSTTWCQLGVSHMHLPVPHAYFCCQYFGNSKNDKVALRNVCVMPSNRMPKSILLHYVLDFHGNGREECFLMTVCVVVVCFDQRATDAAPSGFAIKQNPQQWHMDTTGTHYNTL